MQAPATLRVRDLDVRLDGREILNGLSLDLPRSAIVGLFGDSGCGKSTLALALRGLLRSSRYQTRGEILFDGRNLIELGEREWCAVRGARISIVFQDPLLALNPVLRVGTQIAEIMLEAAS